MKLYELLRKKREAIIPKLSQAAVAKKLRISRTAVSLWETAPEKGGTTPTGRYLFQIIPLYKLDKKELKRSYGLHLSGEEESWESISQSRFTSSISPLLDPSQIKNWLSNPILTSEQRSMTTMIVKENVSKSAFLVRVENDSMLPAPGYSDPAAVYPGFVALIDPEADPKVGKNVLVCIRDKEYVIRQLREDVKGEKFLRAINQSAPYANLQLDENVEIIGVMISASKEY
jgi:transcriptional regulator with XRE-family HTH domain